MSGSKVTAILLDGRILPIGGVASGKVCASSLHSRLVPRVLFTQSSKTNLQYFCELNYFHSVYSRSEAVTNYTFVMQHTRVHGRLFSWPAGQDSINHNSVCRAVPGSPGSAKNFIT